MPTKAELRYITFEALAASAFAFDESKVNRKGGKFAKKGEKHSQKSLGGSTSDSSKGAKTRHEAAEEEEPVLQPTDEGGPEEQGPDDLALYDEENDQWAPK